VSGTQAADRHLTSLHPELAPLESLVARSLASGQTFGCEIGLRPAYQQNEEMAITARATPLRADRGQYALLEMIDATQWRHIDREQALIHQHDTGRRVIYQLAHEIRNPLGGLRGAAQLLERQLPTEELREYTRVIIGEADRLAALTSSLLGPARTLHREQVNVHEITERVRALLEGEAAAGITVQRDYDPSLPPVSVDRDQLLQAFLNVARNAVEAIGRTTGGGRIVLRTRALTNSIIGSTRHRLVASIEVEDNGPGVDPALGDSIFYPLVSGHPGGTGLGLPLAQEILSRYGGLIEYRSRPGQTVFMLRLPLEDTP